MKLLLAIFLFIVTFFGFAYLANIAVINHNPALDNSIQPFVDAHHSASATIFFDSITFFGSAKFLIPAYLILIGIFIYKKRKRTALNIAAIGLTSTAILFILKEIFRRQRPDNPLISGVNGFSFPSGHSFSSFTFYGVIIFLVWRGKMQRWIKISLTVLLILFASTIAYSRIYLRVHFPSDIIAGFCLSVVWLLLALAVFSRGKKTF